MLEILAEHNARATFFVVGEQAEQHPEIVARIVAEGHEVAHHTHTHPHVEDLSRAELAAEMDDALAVLKDLGVEPRWYRPPRGQWTAAQELLARARGMRSVMWAHCLERSHFESADEMAATLAVETEPGDIVLAHDGLAVRTMTVEALPLYLDALDARGLETVTLSELERLSEE